ncbi:MAG TPA: SRPBCC family protein [Candidatus Acidoferrum sp.]|nr:SRPBCC family protein [Candidatus Acidoferrum sp.]
MINVGAMSVTTPSDREILLTRVFNAPRHLVWEAWTSPKHLPKWMLGPDGWTMIVCEIDLRPGGERRLVWSHTNGDRMEILGVFQEVKPPEKLVATESWGGPWPETLVTLDLTEKDGVTTATMTILYPSLEARDAALNSGMKQGMALSFNRLEAHLLQIS